ncbi:MAG: sugar phosphate nucleotidyltransferase [Candidatus Colwellbacteria bacterium]|nr:sugar phosphate nucleotidyltransferase [Candidatus Colwellbacteria bacterium]
MQAVILAAGAGKRLRPLTNDIPKPMVVVSGKPILERTLEILPDEIEEAIMVVGYKKEKIIEYFGGQFGHVRIRYVEQAEPKGTYDALECAKPLLNGGFFLFLHGDELYHPYDLQRCVESNQPTVLTVETGHPERYGICTVDQNEYLLGVQEKPADPKSNLAITGAYLLNSDIFEMSKSESSATKGEYVLAEQIGRWAARTKIKVMRATFWYTVSYPEDVHIADKFLGM